MSYLTVAISLIGLLASLYRQFWSDSANLHKLEMKLEALKARQQVEAERLKASYQRIANEPPQAGQELVDRLNKSIDDLRK